MSRDRDGPERPPSDPGSGSGLPDAPPIHPSFIQVAKPYIFEQTIQDSIHVLGMNPMREESLLLQGVSWIDNVRKVLHLPVRTFNTAVMYYHRFRLVHPDSEYNFMDAAAAALFTACKTEDTLKKSREIVCAAYNLKLSPSEHLAPDDPIFETNARGIIGLERLMLESSGFDFRTRHPQKVLAKLAKHYQLPKGSEISDLAYRIGLDLYRTFAPIKHSTPSLAFSCLELAGRLLDQRISPVESGVDYAQWKTSRDEVMENLFDLLELYTHHRASTVVGPRFPADRFLTVRIPLNQEASEQRIGRHANWHDKTGQHKHAARPTNGITAKPFDGPQRPHHPLSPIAANRDRYRSDRARDAAVRFMIDPDIAGSEKRQVAEYFKVEMEEYEVEE